MQTTGGISGTQRYESLSFHNKYREQDKSFGASVPENQNFKYDFLTVYNMPDLAFRESAAFRGLAGQSKPSDESDLLEKLFKQTEFCTRFCEEINIDDPITKEAMAPFPPAPFIITIGVASGQSRASILSILARIQEFRRNRKYKIHEGSILSEFQRSYVNEPKEVTIFEFRREPDFESILEELEDVEGLEVGYWRLRRAYEGSERTPASWKPK